MALAACCTLSRLCSKENSGVCTPTTTRPLSLYLSAHARTYGSVRSQFTQVNVQNWTRTTLPRRLSGVSAGEFSQAVAPFREGRLPSDNSVGWNIAVDCVFTQASPTPAAASAMAPPPMKRRRVPFMPRQGSRGRLAYSSSSVHPRGPPTHRPSGQRMLTLVEGVFVHHMEEASRVAEAQGLAI